MQELNPIRDAAAWVLLHSAQEPWSEYQLGTRSLTKQCLLHLRPNLFQSMDAKNVCETLEKVVLQLQMPSIFDGRDRRIQKVRLAPLKPSCRLVLDCSQVQSIERSVFDRPRSMPQLEPRTRGVHLSLFEQWLERGPRSQLLWRSRTACEGHLRI